MPVFTNEQISSGNALINAKRLMENFSPKSLHPEQLDEINNSLNDKDFIELYHSGSNSLREIPINLVKIFQDLEKTKTLFKRMENNPELIAKLFSLRDKEKNVFLYTPNNLNCEVFEYILKSMSENIKKEYLDNLLKDYDEFSNILSRNTDYYQWTKSNLALLMRTIIANHLDKKQLNNCMEYNVLCEDYPYTLLRRYKEIDSSEDIKKLLVICGDSFCDLVDKWSILKEDYPKIILESLYNYTSIPSSTYGKNKNYLNELNKTLKYLASQTDEISVDEILPVFNKFIHLLDDENILLYHLLHRNKETDIKFIDPEKAIERARRKDMEKNREEHKYTVYTERGGICVPLW